MSGLLNAGDAVTRWVSRFLRAQVNFRGGERLKRQTGYKFAGDRWVISVTVRLTDDITGRVTQRELELYEIPKPWAGDLEIEVWRHDGWYYGLLNGELRGVAQVPRLWE